jgi:hypothetical protein
MCLWRFANKGASRFDVSTLTCTLVLKDNRFKWKQGTNTKILRIKDVTNIRGCGWHTSWVTVDKFDNTKVSIEERYAKGDLTCAGIFIYIVRCSGGRSFSTGEVSNNFTKCYVSNKRKITHFTSLGEDTSKQVVKGSFGYGCTKDRRGRRTISSRNVGWASGIKPITESTELVRVSAIFSLAVIR